MRTRTALTCALILTASASASACGGGGGSDKASSSNAAPTTEKTAKGATSASGTVDFTAQPVQLTVDPCTLVTKVEAEAVIGPVGDADSSIYDPPKCIYVSSESTGGQLAISLTKPDFCKLLFLTLDQNMFGGAQVHVDDVGDGGMLVKGNGNLQFVVGGGCIEVAGTVDHDTKIDDATMLQLAKTAAERVA